ncbi:hypothetical protein Scep_005842 [Stephania cephalantha]|uniref:Transcription repressor n=1 Tax=Stephania cephalantha TaxID=152367 RepID=A0AAP0KV33_9MAGN
MGNYRFKLSDMIPNAWFYKLKDMGSSSRGPRNQTNSKKKHIISSSSSSTTTTTTKQTHISQHRHSYYFSSDPLKPIKALSDLNFTDPPRKSSRRRSTRRPINAISASPKLAASSVSSNCRCRATLESLDHSVSTTEHSVSPNELNESISPEFESDREDPFVGIDSWTSSCPCRVNSSTTDIIIDMDATKKEAFSGKLDIVDSIPGVELPPILTKPAKFNDMIAEIKNRDVEKARIRRNPAKNFVDKDVPVHRISVKTEKEQRSGSNSHRKSSSVTSPGVKIRANSPRIACKKIQAHNRNSKLRRRNLSDSFAVVKSSFDPQKDFRESMVEMILENNIRASKDLEDLLACYLSLNSNEYHDLIVKVFEQIWFDLTDIHL